MIPDRIFTDLSFPEKPEGNEGSPLYQYATFVVGNVDEYETVKKRIQAVDIGWERYDFIDNTGMSDTMTENFAELEKMSSLIPRSLWKSRIHPYLPV